MIRAFKAPALKLCLAALFAAPLPLPASSPQGPKQKPSFEITPPAPPAKTEEAEWERILLAPVKKMLPADFAEKSEWEQAALIAGGAVPGMCIGAAVGGVCGLIGLSAALWPPDYDYQSLEAAARATGAEAAARAIAAEAAVRAIGIVIGGGMGVLAGGAAGSRAGSEIVQYSLKNCRKAFAAKNSGSHKSDSL